MYPLDVSCVSLSAKRPGRLRLCLAGGSVFANFTLDYFGIVALEGISFDGFGASRVGGLTTRMSSRDSRMLLESVVSHQLDSPLVEELLRRYLRENADVLWRDAMLQHDLL